MIFDAIVAILLGLLEGVLALIPAYDLPELGDLTGGLGSALAAANGVFPVTTIGTCLMVLLGLRVLIGGWWLITFVYDRIPFKMT